MASALPLLALAARAAPLDPAAYDPLGVLAAAGEVTIDTDALTLDDGATVWQGVEDQGVAVFTFDAITLEGDVTVIGARPLALLSREALVVTGTIDLAARGSTGGPGGYAGGVAAGEDGAGPCGGLGNNSAGGGAFGGDGGGGGSGGAGAAGGVACGDLRQQLEGGSGGARSANDGGDGAGGGGGGAIELGALGPVVIAATARIDASGAPGQGRSGNADGGGGGAGGGILVHGVGGTCEGALVVAGGPGSEGGGDGFGGGGGGGGRILVDGLSSVTGLLDVQRGDRGTGGKGPGEPGERGLAEVVLDVDADGWSVDEGDCAEADPLVHPGAPEATCNAVDDDCDPATLDDGDADGDGAWLCGGDCDDGDGAVYPGAPDDPFDGVDSDCDGAAEGPPPGDTGRAPARPAAAVRGGPAGCGCGGAPVGDPLLVGVIVVFLTRRHTSRTWRTPANRSTKPLGSSLRDPRTGSPEHARRA